LDGYFKIEGIKLNTYNKLQENIMEKLDRKEIRKIITESMISSKADKRESELKEFSKSKSGKRVMIAGQKISGASGAIREVAEDQTGSMRGALNRISEFVNKLGESLSGLSNLSEGSSMTETLPTLAELKQLRKDIEKLEK